MAGPEHDGETSVPIHRECGILQLAVIREVDMDKFSDTVGEGPDDFSQLSLQG